MQTVEGKTVISGLWLYACHQYRLLITVGGVGGDFSQTVIYVNLHISCFFRNYYYAMHFSAKRDIAIACRLSVCL